ncbi:MAG: DUF3575 domain-containing protein [Flavobacteriales bacterium]|nr:DUF3575 domain-containing protein [Flavobacteriales bacterium]
MKKQLTYLTILSLFLFQGNAILAQGEVELKINPVGALFGFFDVAGEYMVNENFGAELSLGLVTGKATTVDVEGADPTKSGFGVMGYGKYYFSPDQGCDRFYAGVYLRQRSWKVEDGDNEDYAAFKRSIVGAGIGVGYKVVGDSGILFEIGFGIGRAISEKNEWVDENNEGGEFPNLGVDGIGRLAVGYRF